MTLRAHLEGAVAFWPQRGPGLPVSARFLPVRDFSLTETFGPGLPNFGRRPFDFRVC